MMTRLSNTITFQKILTQFAGATTGGEAEAAECAARRLIETRDIDPVEIPNVSFRGQHRFDDNALLTKLRDQWRMEHPNYHYGKPNSMDSVRRLKRKPRPAKPKPDSFDATKLAGIFDDFFASLER